MRSLELWASTRITLLTFFRKKTYHRRFYCSKKDELFPVEKIRNFSIIAHIDHGKSTLADRLLELTGAIKPGNEKAQVLDQLQVERERGITVKAVTASLNYEYKGENYLLNLIDTPGHVDFSNEVVRSVQACQGAILLVDAAQGPQAQTVAVHSLAKTRGLTLITILNKIDLPRANPERAKKQLHSLFKIDPEEILQVSAKKGWGVKEVLDAIVERIPPPVDETSSPFHAFVFDTWYDKYRGILCLSHIKSGTVKVGDPVRWKGSKKPQTIKFLSMLTPEEKPIRFANSGQVVLIGCGPRCGGGVGEELISNSIPFNEAAENLDRLKAQPKHMVFAGLFPVVQSEHLIIQSALNKLIFNDASVSLIQDSSPALGHGWRMGFLGLLHLDVFSQRLFQEHKAEVILTAPSVPYKVKIFGAKALKQYGSEIVTVTNPAHLPDTTIISEYYEPFVIGTIILPIEYIGPVISLCVDRRGVPIENSAVDEQNTLMSYRFPLSEIVVDFHDKLKSITSGYASFDYQDDGYDASPLSKLEIHLNGTPVEELTAIVHSSRVEYNARRMVEKLKEMVPRQMVQIAIQAVCRGKVIARETLAAYRKDVTSKLYGGDVTRRMKLLKQQAEGKKKMRSIANIQIPRDIFMNVLKK